MNNDFINNTKKEISQVFWLFDNLDKKIKTETFLLFFLCGVITALELYIPFLYRDFINHSIENLAINILMIFFGVYTVKKAIDYYANFRANIVVVDAEKYLKKGLYKKIFNSSGKNINKYGSGYYSDIIANDTMRGSAVINFSNIKGIFSLIALLSSIIILFFNDAITASLSCLYTAAYVYIYLMPVLPSMKGKIPGFDEFNRVMEERRNLVSFTEDSLKGKNEFNFFLSAENERKRYHGFSGSVFSKMQNIWKLEMKYFIIPFQTLKIAFYSLVFIGMYFEFFLFKNITADKILFLLMYSQIAESSIEPFLFILFKIRNTYSPSILKIREIMEIEEEKPEKFYNIKEISEINFENVSFSYDKKSFIEDITLKIRKGEKIAITGKSGAGKSTMLKLLLGEEKSSAGRISMNQINIDLISNESLYETAGILSQNSYIFNRSIIENITLGRETDSKKLKKVIEMSGVSSFVYELENGLETLAGHGGSSLSGGQRVRIALARLMLDEKEIIILDEPLEGVDKINEEEIIKNIREYIKDKTVIIISHRFSILSMAERFIILEDGKITGDGSYNELMKNDNLITKFMDAESRMADIQGS